MSSSPKPIHSRVKSTCIGLSVAVLVLLSSLLLVRLWLHSIDPERNYIKYGMHFLPPGGIHDGVPIADRYGQWIQATWPEKVFDDGDLLSRASIEQSEMLHAQIPTDRDQWGGWQSGPKKSGTGFFRTTFFEGKWWLVDPSGRLFFSIGIDGLDDSPQACATAITGRTSYFAELPDQSGPYSTDYYDAESDKGVAKTKCFNFYNANLQRKFGRDWPQRWAVETDDRLKLWGFNTVGIWSDGYLNSGRQRPYVIGIGSRGVYNTIRTGADYWGPMPDAYDPKFVDALRWNILRKTRGRQHDPWLIGYFLDNELSWWGQRSNRNLGIRLSQSLQYGIPIGVLAQNADSSPAKRAFLSLLRSKYVVIGKLNSAWQTNFSSWNDLLTPYQVSATPTSAQTEDLSILLGDYAIQYFWTVNHELKMADPNHLYLGCRFAGSAPPEVVNAAASYCDVVSFNSYFPPSNYGGWPCLLAINKPCLISEFGAGATDRGLYYAGLIDVRSQKNRGKYFENYLQAALQNPRIVGCQWFQYVDQPVTGRAFDGENGNYGVVDIADTPFPELVSAFKRINFMAYKLRMRT